MKLLKFYVTRKIYVFTSVTANWYISRTFMMFCMIFAIRFVTQNIRQKQLSKMGSAFSSVLTEQHSPSSSCHLRFHIRCHSGFLETKQRVGLTLHTYLMVGTYVFQGETRYMLHCLHVTMQPWIYSFELCNQSLGFMWICIGICRNEHRWIYTPASFWSFF